MENEINEKQLLNYYSIALDFYKRCIEKQDNSFLSDEIGMDIRDVKISNQSISIIYTGSEVESRKVEVKLKLYSKNNLELGHYTLSLGDECSIIEDFLVFTE